MPEKLFREMVETWGEEQARRLLAAANGLASGLGGVAPVETLGKVWGGPLRKHTRSALRMLGVALEDKEPGLLTMRVHGIERPIENCDARFTPGEVDYEVSFEDKGGRVPPQRAEQQAGVRRIDDHRRRPGA